MTTNLGLSDLYLPFPARSNPFADEATQVARDAAVRSRLLADPVLSRRFDAFSTLPAHFFPSATTERLTACAFFVNWLFFVDDLCDDDGAHADLAALRVLMEQHLAILRTGDLPAEVTPLALYSLAVRSRLLPLFGPARHARFCDVVEHYLLEGTLRAATNRVGRLVPDLDSYSRQREADGGSFTVIALIEIAGDFELPPVLAGDAEVARLRLLCARILSFVNDVVSYQKEVLAQGSPNNLIRVFQQHAQQTFEQAVSTSIELINFLTMEFEGLARVVSARDPLLARFVHGLEDLIQGNAHWSLDTGRYCSPDSPFPELRRAPPEMFPFATEPTEERRRSPATLQSPDPLPLAAARR